MIFGGIIENAMKMLFLVCTEHASYFRAQTDMYMHAAIFSNSFELFFIYLMVKVFEKVRLKLRLGKSKIIKSLICHYMIYYF